MSYPRLGPSSVLVRVLISVRVRVRVRVIGRVGCRVRGRLAVGAGARVKVGFKYSVGVLHHLGGEGCNVGKGNEKNFRAPLAPPYAWPVAIDLRN